MPNNKVTLQDVYQLIEDFRHDVANQYVTRKEFVPVKTVVYGMVGLVLAGVLTAFLARVVVALGF